MYPGCTESLQRIFVNTCPPEIKEDTISDKDKPEDGADKADDSQEFESRHTYLLIKFSLSEAINPAIDP